MKLYYCPGTYSVALHITAFGLKPPVEIVCADFSVPHGEAFRGRAAERSAVETILREGLVA